jgi:cobalt-zinc-cadmium efflux system outer membrane protein
MFCKEGKRKKIKSQTMTKRVIFLTLLVIIPHLSMPGQDIQVFLNLVREHNPEIVAYGKLLNVKRNEARTGIAPPGPSLSFGYMPGTTDETGTKTTWSVSQSFSFPTKYILQNKISKITLIAAEEEYKIGILNTLLKAKLLLCDLIYDRKTMENLINRKELYDRLKMAWGKMLDSGEATVMEYNKILLELSSLNLRIDRISSDITMLKHRLEFMSGESADPTSVISYNIEEETDYETLISDKMSIHPAFLLPESEYQIGVQEVRLARAGNLPEFQAGVGSESVPGETFTGPVAGISIPLWANSYKVKAAVSRAEHLAAIRDATLLDLKTGVMSEYENKNALEKSMNETKDIILKSEDKNYLDKALSAGEISLTDYFIYIDSYFQAEDRYYEIENEYHKSLARLYDHNLVR